MFDILPVNRFLDGLLAKMVEKFEGLFAFERGPEMVRIST
jgi:hypothetical protein